MPTQACAGEVALVSSSLVSAVSNVVKGLAAAEQFLFSDRGKVDLKGFDEPVRLYEVRWWEEGS